MTARIHATDLAPGDELLWEGEWHTIIGTFTTDDRVTIVLDEPPTETPLPNLAALNLDGPPRRVIGFAPDDRVAVATPRPR